ncbi:MarR family winged helix-turn-helix transcriptional regulator [Methylobacterium nigriterrae]|uniref:MarR family winged helix-turn-helix transcriptional regulator n=1 Tax=Methylobacterium nigriterrae TaxID=3127512 RepID=UPI003013B84B
MSAELHRLRRAYTLALLQAGRLWRRAADAVVDRHGLSDATALPLLLIGRLSEEPRQATLAEAVGVEGPTLVRLLDQLCAAGLIARREDPTDRRAKVLALTEAGRIAVAAIEAELETLRATVFAGISAADLEASLRVFQALQDYTRGEQARGEGRLS